MLKFSKGGKATAASMHEDDLGLLDAGSSSAMEGGVYLVQGIATIQE